MRVEPLLDGPILFAGASDFGLGLMLGVVNTSVYFVWFLITMVASERPLGLWPPVVEFSKPLAGLVSPCAAVEFPPPLDPQPATPRPATRRAASAAVSRDRITANRM